MRIPGYARAGGVALVVAAALAGALLSGVLIQRGRYAASERAHTRQILAVVCARVHRLDAALEGLVAVSSTRKALLQTAYYRTHPDELALALERARDNARVLRRADCLPEVVPTTSP